jgi:glycosyltransferase involved in cell wall biosynthesis
MRVPTVNPLVSVITPVYNGSKYIRELIGSVQRQSYKNIEHIVIDDGSTDDGATVRILRSFPQIRWSTRPNRGQYATLNEGIAQAKGEIITIISADDKYAGPDVIGTAVWGFGRNRMYDAVYGDTIRIDENGVALAGEPPRSNPVWMYKYYPGISHCSLLITRDFLMKQDIRFDETLRYVGDYDWILRIIRAGCRFKRIRSPIAMYRYHASQLSLDMTPRRVEELEEMRVRYGKPNPAVAFIVNKWWRGVKLWRTVEVRVCNLLPGGSSMRATK